jgi:sialate O-acetylesterase
MKKTFWGICLGVLFLSGCAKESSLRLAPIFTDHMVLQRQQPIRVWGWAAPQTTLSLRLDTLEAHTQADADGRWMVTLPPLEAGGPYTLEVRAGATSLRIRDVLIGEVWLASGQSNMEMPLLPRDAGWSPKDSVLGATEAIRQANCDQIRLLTVERAVALTPQATFNGTWKVCSSETLPTFSAVAYFFGKTLHDSLSVPIGLILSSWGGTPAEAWVDREHLRELPDFRDLVARLEATEPVLHELEAWRAQLTQREVPPPPDTTFWATLELDDRRYAQTALNDTLTMMLPTRWEDTKLGAFDGVVWFQKTVEVPEGWIGRNLILELGPIDDMDRTYFNGQQVGGYQQLGYWETPRRYRIPAELVKRQNLIAVRVIDTQGGGGLWGQPEQLRLYPEGQPEVALSLAGSWRYLPVAELVGRWLYVFGEGARSYAGRPKLPIALGSNTPTTLFNGMIYPLIPFSIRGVIWYQGESNVGRAGQYERLFPMLIQCWRKHWNLGDFPFYFVQIAPYDYGPQARAQRLREAQLRTMLRVPNTGMVVTTDVGDDRNIHPARKQEVGQRLALWALANTYGREDIVFSGPIYERMTREGNRIRLHFRYAEGGLVLRQPVADAFVVAGADRVFYPAHVRVEGNTLVAWSPQVPNPQAVRYAWSNTPHAVLFNQAGLPASPFRTDDWPEGE